jgi:hypothetical protein
MTPSVTPAEPQEEMMNIKDFLDFKGLDKDEVKILDYMCKTNRPYSAINVFDNLHGSIKKKYVIKKLDRLSQTKNLTRKDFGKSSIFWINQELIDGKHKKNFNPKWTNLRWKRPRVLITHAKQNSIN